MNGSLLLRRLWADSFKKALTCYRPSCYGIQVFGFHCGANVSKYSTSERKVSLTKVGEILQQNIAAKGAITVAEFMKECLQHPFYGYYMKETVLGRQGDFVTAPEISQTFGEMVGLWFVSLAEERYSSFTKPFRLVELGPGIGTLMNDMLRTMAQFPWFYRHITVHLVETSPALMKQQQLTLTRYKQKGVNLFWHRNIDEVPSDGSFFIIAQEFFDALPIHQFVWKENGWQEKLIDIETRQEEPFHFRYVLSGGSTTASRVFLDFLGYHRNERGDIEDSVMRDGVELSPQSLSIVQSITTRLTQSSGAFLVIDYGANQHINDSLRAIRSHEFVPVLREPGEADLSADVNFLSLRKAYEQTPALKKSQGNSFRPICLGPISQRQFLLSMGIEYRVVQLVLSSKTDEEAADIHKGYKS
ncbi:NADH dehydrogenase [ubiquinone] complex I, assembly factor 7 [Galdieria sulphuraria]|nr:NADH dehydrogenase [ubiquinone] complex I, assembly factor 7 [Galdieria sulphuraria]